MAVHQVGLEINTGVTIFIILSIAQRLIASLELRINQVAFLVTACSREHRSRLSGTTATAAVPTVETEQTLCLQSRDNHTKILLNTKQCLDLARCNEVVALLSNSTPRVSTVRDNRNGTIAIASRMNKWQGTESFTESIISITTLFLKSVQITTDVYTKHGCLGHVHIDIGAQVVLLVVGCIIKHQALILLQQTCLLEVRSNNRVTQEVGTTTDI